jgi:hypothetical protein
MSKQPYIPLYTGDYLQDTRMLPLNVRGAWVELMIHMWRSKERGVIVGTMPEFAMMMGCQFEEANFAIGLLQQKSICDYEIMANGMLKLICRRMVREAKTSIERSEAGKAGVEARKAKAIAKANEQAKTKQNTDNDIGIKTDTEFKNELKKVEEKIEIIEDRLTSALDELYIDQQRQKWSHVDFDIELMAFKEKVRGSPDHYKTHDTGGLRLAFQSQLRGAKKKSNGITSTKGTSRTTSAQISGSDYSAGL